MQQLYIIYVNVLNQKIIIMDVGSNVVEIVEAVVVGIIGICVIIVGYKLAKSMYND